MALLGIILLVLCLLFLVVLIMRTPNQLREDNDGK